MKLIIFITNMKEKYNGANANWLNRRIQFPFFFLLKSIFNDIIQFCKCTIYNYSQFEDLNKHEEKQNNFVKFC